MHIRNYVNSLLLAAALLAAIFQEIPTFSQTTLPAGWERAVNAINEKSVTATISFLASDELAGRGTPSTGYLIASAYVAARFRGAGLQGGMPDGSFFQEHRLRTVRTPQEGITFVELTGQGGEVAGLLAAGDEKFEYQGEIPIIDIANLADEVRHEGPVAAREVPTDAGPQRAVAQLARQVNVLVDAGATALVLYVAESSPLVNAIQRNRDRARPDSSRSRFAIPVLLVVGQPPAQLSAKVVLPKKVVDEALVRNVIGVLPGSSPDRRDEAVIISAHLDHLGENPNESDDWIYNGADDNASGSTAVMTLADAFAALDERPARTLIFICYWGEESGLLGSRQFADQPTWPLEKIVANVNIEMIGRPEAGAREKIWVTGWGESDLGPIMRAAAAPHGFEIFEHPSYSARLYRASDNWSLVQRGVVAHSFSAGSLHGDYHQPSDEWEKLDLPHMTRVIEALFWGSLPLANGDVTPRKK